jgi:hypothetical protein
MTQALSEAVPAKARKRNPAKTPSRQRFAVHATYSDMDRSALFAEMIREHCKRFIVSDRAKVADEAIQEISS